MAIIPNLETTRKLTSQAIYDIIHFSAQSAEDNGFVNQYVFERALYAYAAIILYPDRKEEIGRMVSNNILDAQQYLQLTSAEMPLIYLNQQSPVLIVAYGLFVIAR